LLAFVEVVRQGGFSQAAKVVFATQSTVSKAVKQLEDEVGVPLLDRTGHRSTLTAAGEVVFRRGLKLPADRDDLMAELDELRGLKRGTLIRQGKGIAGTYSN
jgi:DNA-binding transcriptional LysR family regulator